MADHDLEEIAFLAERDMIKAKMDEVVALIKEHFTIVQAGPDRVLQCNDCDRTVTWVTRHLAERHDMDIEVWRLPRFAEDRELW